MRITRLVRAYQGKMIDRDRAVDDVEKIAYELLCVCAWQSHACLVVADAKLVC